MIISKKTTILPLIISFLVTLSGVVIGANSDQRISREEYVARYKHIAIEHQRYYGIPASITMAQGILESDSGNSHLAKGSNNHFGIKCKSNWTGRTFTHTDDAPDECFRAYDNVEASYEDHADFLDSSPRYDSLFRFSPTDYRSWARGLKGAGYATAPDYAQRLVKLIEDNKLYLLDIEADGSATSITTPVILASDQEPAERVVGGSNLDPNGFHISVGVHNGYNIYKVNHTTYIKAKGGDTLKSIASKFNLTEKMLLRYNDLSSAQSLSGGEKIFVERKQSKWRGNIHYHTVKKGDTIHSISQDYAIKESTLRRMNKLKKGAYICEGEHLRVK